MLHPGAGRPRADQPPVRLTDHGRGRVCHVRAQPQRHCRAATGQPGDAAEPGIAPCHQHHDLWGYPPLRPTRCRNSTSGHDKAKLNTLPYMMHYVAIPVEPVSKCRYQVRSGGVNASWSAEHAFRAPGGGLGENGSTRVPTHGSRRVRGTTTPAASTLGCFAPCQSPLGRWCWQGRWKLGRGRGGGGGGDGRK